MNKIWICIIMVFIIFSITSFFYLQNKKDTIEVANYNRTSTLILGKYRLSELSSTKSDSNLAPLVTFKFKDADEEQRFLDDINTMTSYLGIKQYHEESNAYHYFFSDGYYYILRKSKYDVYSLEPLYSHFLEPDLAVNVRFHFPCYIHFNSNENNSIKLKMTFDELINFYERFSDDEVTIDYQHKVVYSAVAKEYQSGIITGKPIKITWQEDEILIQWIEN